MAIIVDMEKEIRKESPKRRQKQAAHHPLAESAGTVTRGKMILRCANNAPIHTKRQLCGGRIAGMPARALFSSLEHPPPLQQRTKRDFSRAQEIRLPILCLRVQLFGIGFGSTIGAPVRNRRLVSLFCAASASVTFPCYPVLRLRKWFLHHSCK